MKGTKKRKAWSSARKHQQPTKIIIELNPGIIAIHLTRFDFGRFSPTVIKIVHKNLNPLPVRAYYQILKLKEVPQNNARGMVIISIRLQSNAESLIIELFPLVLGQTSKFGDNALGTRRSDLPGITNILKKKLNTLHMKKKKKKYSLRNKRSLHFFYVSHVNSQVFLNSLKILCRLVKKSGSHHFSTYFSFN